MPILRDSAVAMLAVLAASVANAATTGSDVQVMARAVGFVSGLPRGTIIAAVVDGPNADSVVAAMNAGVNGGGVTLLPRKVPASGLVASGARVIIVPEGMESQYATIAAAAKSLHAVTVSTDMNCVKQAHCVVGVVARPRVDILVSREASKTNGVSFNQAFRIMIREI